MDIDRYKRTNYYFLANCESAVRTLQSSPKLRTNKLTPTIHDLSPTELKVVLPDLLSAILRLGVADNNLLTFLTKQELNTARKSLLPLEMGDIRAAAIFKNIWQSGEPSKEVNEIFGIADWRLQSYLHECERAYIETDPTIEITSEYLLEAYNTIRGEQNFLKDLGVGEGKLLEEKPPEEKRKKRTKAS